MSCLHAEVRCFENTDLSFSFFIAFFHSSSQHFLSAFLILFLLQSSPLLHFNTVSPPLIFSLSATQEVTGEKSSIWGTISPPTLQIYRRKFWDYHKKSFKCPQDFHTLQIHPLLTHISFFSLITLSTHYHRGHVR